MDIKSTIDGSKEIEFKTCDAEGLIFEVEGRKEQLKIIERSADGKNLVVNLSGKKFEARVLSMDSAKKELLLKINGESISLKIEDHYDILLKSMGMGAGAVKKINDMKAPMPGVVLDIKVTAGQEVAKDEAIVVLEAMKMENLLKSPVDGIIKSIEVEKGDTVEKNRVLINFE